MLDDEKLVESVASKFEKLTEVARKNVDEERARIGDVKKDFTVRLEEAIRKFFEKEQEEVKYLVEQFEETIRKQAELHRMKVG